MKTRWMLAVGLGLLLAAQGLLANAQNLDRGQPATDDLDKITREGLPYATAVEAALGRGNALLQNGKESEALQEFAAAITMATRAKSHPDLTYGLYRQGTAHMRLFEHTSGVEHLKAAIASWEKERALYQEHDYPIGFVAMVDFSLGRAYLDLARYENVAENSERALKLLENAVAQFRTAITSYQAALRPR